MLFKNQKYFLQKVKGYTDTNEHYGEKLFGKINLLDGSMDIEGSYPDCLSP